MACRVGMSTQPRKRIRHWQNEEGHNKSRILKTGLTYRQALAYEKQAAESYRCNHRLGGPPKRGRVWSVYVVSGGKAGKKASR